MGRCGDTETRGYGDAEMGRWEEKKMGGRGDAGTRRRGDGEIMRNSLPIPYYCATVKV
ncbi:hypothetical protein DSM107003_02870 [Trichormus variabilis SAG 1403-4b]|uniref:Uncharacterized protein n=1 Tax=Trichormus variabilis SAG 1403-4b TaxID=447716 RepID=A0A3S1CBE3_ANAVA|nr:hypothetical protein DSM107003_02870 [Trichormus variabilis SAG 1403-4b]